jgi:acyl-CoA synthetase (AMP-forming)/AMP-acid ligase II
VHLSSLVEMVESGLDDRAVLGSRESALTGAQFGRLVRTGATAFQGASAVVYVGENHPFLPVALLSAAWAGVPFVPINYRLEDRQLNDLVARHAGSLVLVDAPSAQRLSGATTCIGFDDWLAALSTPVPSIDPSVDDGDVAVVLYTSGTTSEPKAALLRHRHLMAYLLGSVEFGGAHHDDAVLVAVPPYHVAGVANMLSNLFAGRRLVYMSTFDPAGWLETVRRERITHAMVVPTMLSRIVGTVDGDNAETPTLRSLSYGGARMSERVLLHALRLFPQTGFVNAYGLTETASTIAVLGPEDHRRAIESNEPVARQRLASAGRVLPSVEVEIREENGEPLPIGRTGMIFVRGEQVSGEYSSGSLLDEQGWFCTRDHGYVDGEGYLFIEGRADDTIIRGGENIAPAEIEDVLLTHPDVAEACVVGLPDQEWGQRIAAAVVRHEGAQVGAAELQSLVRDRLRGSKMPELIVFRDQLPHTETGKLLRRVVLTELADQRSS